MTKKGLVSATEVAAICRAARELLSGFPGWSELGESERVDRSSQVASAARQAARFSYRGVLWGALAPVVQNRLLHDAAAELGYISRPPANDGMHTVPPSGLRPVIGLHTRSVLPLEPHAESLPPYPEALSSDFRHAPAASVALLDDDAIARVSRAFAAILGHQVTDVQTGMLVAVSMIELSMPRQAIDNAPNDEQE